MAKWSDNPYVAIVVVLAFGALGSWWAWYGFGGPETQEMARIAHQQPRAWRLTISGAYRQELTLRTRTADRLVRTALVTHADYRRLSAALNRQVDSILMPIRMTDESKTVPLSDYRADCLEYIELGVSLLNALAAESDGRADVQQRNTARVLAQRWPNVNRKLAEKRRRAEELLP